jgi:hypothetical protein
MIGLAISQLSIIEKIATILFFFDWRCVFSVPEGMNGEGETGDDQDTNAFDGDSVARHRGLRDGRSHGFGLAPGIAR